MKPMMAMMRLLPKVLTDRMRAPMLDADRIREGNLNPVGIKMNVTNLLICGEHCGTCPSFPERKGEALFCAGGKSGGVVSENGCNCLACPLFDQCGYGSGGYFCLYGAASEKGESSAERGEESGSYIARFLLKNEEREEPSETGIQKKGERSEPVDVTLSFLGDQNVHTTSTTTLLHASLEAGIQHTHVCGGNARCSTCRVNVVEGVERCPPRNKKEFALAASKGFSPNVRLACQTTSDGDITLRRLVLDANDISEAIMEGRARSGQVGREISATILFADIRSFTSFSEKHLPYDIIHILNRYFSMFGKHIDDHGGYIDKYMGDGIMAIFGLDKQLEENSTFLATQAAISMLRSMNEFNRYLVDNFNHSFTIGIGIHTGNLIVGNLGFYKKVEYTAIGDTVNTASRIESLNKRTKTSLLLSESAFQEVRHRFKWRKKYQGKVKGKREPIVVYEPSFK